MRIIFFGDGEWAHLSLKRLLLLHDIVVIGVVVRHNKPDAILTEISNSHNIPVYDFAKVNSAGALDIIEKMAPDLCVSMSYDQIIGEELRNIPKLGFINCHAGKLPYYRGRNILNWALINDEKEFGITVHFVDGGIDTGDIISQVLLPIEDNDDYMTLLRKSIEKCPEVLIDAVLKIKKGNYSVIVQNHLSGSYFSYRRQGDEYIDWNWTSRRIFNHVRAITRPGPGAFTYHDKTKLFIWKAEMTSYESYISTPGEIIGCIKGGGYIVKTGDTAIALKEVSYESKIENNKPHLKVGERLGVNPYTMINQLEQRIRLLEERWDKHE